MEGADESTELCARFLISHNKNIFDFLIGEEFSLFPKDV